MFLLCCLACIHLDSVIAIDHVLLYLSHIHPYSYSSKPGVNADQYCRNNLSAQSASLHSFDEQRFLYHLYLTTMRFKFTDEWFYDESVNPSATFVNIQNTNIFNFSICLQMFVVKHFFTKFYNLLHLNVKNLVLVFMFLLLFAKL